MDIAPEDIQGMQKDFIHGVWRETPYVAMSTKICCVCDLFLDQILRNLHTKSENCYSRFLIKHSFTVFAITVN